MWTHLCTFNVAEIATTHCAETFPFSEGLFIGFARYVCTIARLGESPENPALPALPGG
jgi:hypothetical protein